MAAGWFLAKAKAEEEDGGLLLWSASFACPCLLCLSGMLFSYGWHHVLSEARGRSTLLVTTFLPSLSGTSP